MLFSCKHNSRSFNIRRKKSNWRTKSVQHLSGIFLRKRNHQNFRLPFNRVHKISQNCHEKKIEVENSQVKSDDNSILGKRKRLFIAPEASPRDIGSFYRNNITLSNHKRHKLRKLTKKPDNININLPNKMKESLVALGKYINAYSGTKGVHYIPKRKIAHGAYGVVIEIEKRGLEGSNCGKFVLKRIDLKNKGNWYLKQILNEVRINKYLKKKEMEVFESCNIKINTFVDCVKPKNMNTFDEIMMIFQKKKFTLRDFLTFIREEVKNWTNDLREKYLRFIKRTMFELLKQLHLLHSIGVLHMDIKSANVLLNTHDRCSILDMKYDIFLIDYSLSCSTNTRYCHNGKFVDVISLWYRPIELLVPEMKGIVDSACDIWSLGYLFLEMFVGRSVFAGNNTVNEMINKLYQMKNDNLLQKLKGQYAIPNDAFDLIQWMIQFEKNERITCYEALQHVYFKEFKTKKVCGEIDSIGTYKKEKVDIEYDEKTYRRSWFKSDLFNEARNIYY